MVEVYAVDVSEDDDALHIWIPADKIPPVPFIKERLASQEIDLLAYYEVPITYFGDDIPTLLQHLEETYSYTLPQIRTIILWCGERIPQSKCLELLKKART